MFDMNIEVDPHHPQYALDGCGYQLRFLIDLITDRRTLEMTEDGLPGMYHFLTCIERTVAEVSTSVTALLRSEGVDQSAPATPAAPQLTEPKGRIRPRRAA